MTPAEEREHRARCPWCRRHDRAEWQRCPWCRAREREATIRRLERAATEVRPPADLHPELVGAWGRAQRSELPAVESAAELARLVHVSARLHARDRLRAHLDRLADELDLEDVATLREIAALLVARRTSAQRGAAH